MSMNSHPEDWTTPEWREYARHVREELVPKLESSIASLSIVPEGVPDVKFAVELGMAIMLDKPIIAVVVPGVKVPDRLVRVADHIIEADLDTEAGKRSAAKRIGDALREYR